MTNKKLLEISKSAMENSYSPYSGYKVGAALLCSDGMVTTGVNVENISYGATICAERAAFLKAISEGKRNFSKIAVAASGDEVPIPCGMCLQVMSEFAGEDFEIIAAGGKGELKTFKFSQLLPNIFNFKSVERKE